MKTIAELVKLFVSNKNKIDELKRENQHAVYEYVSRYVSDGEIVISLRKGDDYGKKYAVHLKRESDAGLFECGEDSVAYVCAYPLKKNGEVAKIGITHLDLNKIEKLTK